MCARTTKHSGGYTLLEMIVVVVIISIVIPVLFSSIAALYETHATTISRALALSSATKGVKEVARDVRASVYSESGGLPIVAIATSSLTLYADTDLDGRVEQVRYFLDGTTVRKGVIEPTATSSYPASTETLTILTENVVNNETASPVFRYYTSTSTEVTSSLNTLDVRRVTVEFIAESRFGSKRSQVTLRASASSRNLKEAY